MTPAEAIIKALSDLIGYLAARGADAIVGKWVAYVTIAWQKGASDAARAKYDETMAALMQSLPAKYEDWQKWRDSLNRGGSGNGS